jgi:hypothetical protein
MTSSRFTWQRVLFVAFAVAAIFFVAWNHEVLAASGNVTISSASTFASLDGSADDADGSEDGTFTVNGSLVVADGGSIMCNDVAPLAEDDGACAMHFDVLGNFAVQSGGALSAENRRGGGNGGDIVADVGGDFSIESGAVISARNTSGAGDARIGGVVAIHVAGNVSVEPGSQVLADSPAEAGVIAITGTKIDINGIVSSVGRETSGRGGAISIVAARTLTIPDKSAVRSHGSRTFIPLAGPGDEAGFLTLAKATK